MDKLMLQILIAILPSITENFRGGLVQFLDDLEKKASETKNQYDDIAVKILCAMLNV